MKQTNNAIKFLMAQYRAIFKNAYFKGLVSATLLTAAMAASQAQAAQALNDVSTINNKTGTVETLNIDGTNYTLNVSGAGTVEGNRDGSTFDKAAIITKNLNITSGTASFETAAGGAKKASNTPLYIQSEKKLSVSSGATLNFGTIISTVAAERPAEGDLDVRFGTMEFKSGSTVNINAGSTDGFTRVDAKQLNIQGEVNVNNSKSENAFLTGDKITISGKDANVTVGSKSQGATSRAVLGWRGEATYTPAANTTGVVLSKVLYSGSDISVANGAQVTLQGLSTTSSTLKAAPNTDGAQIWGNSLSLTGGSLLNVTNQGGTVAVHNTKFENSFVDVTNDSALAFKPVSYVAVTGEKHPTTGSNRLDNPTLNNHRFVNGTVSFTNSTVNLNNNGEIQLHQGGTLSIDDKSFITGGKISLKNDTDGDKKNIQGTTNATLQLSSATLDKYLNSTKETAKDYNKTDIGDSLGKVELNQGARVHFTDETQVDLAKFTFANTTTHNAGEILVGEPTSNADGLIGKEASKLYTIKGDIRFVAKDLLVSKDLSSGGTLSSTNATLEATKLTLGSSEYANEGKTLGFKNAFARDLYVIHSGSELFKLTDAVTLQSYEKKTAIDDDGNVREYFEATAGHLDDLTLYEASDGRIAGVYNLTVDGGLYEVSDLGLNGGALKVTNSLNGNAIIQARNPKFASELNVGTLELDMNIQDPSSNDIKNHNNILVEGQNSRLTIGSIDAKGSKGSTKLLAINGGVIELDATEVQKFIDAASDADSANNQKVYFSAVNGGTLKLNGGLEYNYNKDNANNQELNNIVGINRRDGGLVNGNLDADYLRINAQGSELHTLEKAGTYNLNEFSLNSLLDDGTAQETITLKVTDGKTPVIFNIAQDLNSVNKNLNLKDGVVIHLGTAEFVLDEYGNSELNDSGREYYQAITKTGTVDVENLLVGGRVQVRVGDWTGHDFTLQDNGTLIVGSNYLGIDDEILGASLTGNKLGIEGGSATVRESAKATFTELNTENAGSGSLIVLGNMTVVGTDVTEDKTLDDGTEQTIAVKTSAGSITVGNNQDSSVRGYLTFNNQAVTNSIFDSQDGTSVTLKSGFAEDTFNVYNNSVVKLDFASGTSFNGDELISLRDQLFNEGSNGLLNIGDATFTGLEDKFTGSEANNDLAIKWNDLKDFTFIEGLGNITSNKLAKAKVLGVNSEFRAHVGSMELAAGSSARIVGDSSFSNASGNNGKYISDASGKVAGASVTNGSILDLNNGGEIGRISLGENSLLRTGQDPETTSETTIAEVTGDGYFVAGATKTFVTGNVNVVDIENIQDSYLEIGGTLNATGDLYTEGQLLVKGKANIKGDIDINAKAEFQSDLIAAQGIDIYADTTVAGDVTIEGGSSEIADDALFKAKTITLKKGAEALLLVGEEAGEDVDGTKWESSAGFVQAARLDLNGGTLIADPEYGKNASIAAFTTVGAEKAVDTTKGNVAGTLNGDIVVARNSVVALGLADNAEDGTVFEQLEKYLLPSFVDANGSLKKDEVGSILFIGKALNLEASDTTGTTNAKSARLVLDSSKAASDYLNATDKLNKQGKYDKAYSEKIASNNIYLGGNTVLAIDEGAIDQNNANRGAIHIEQKGASIYGDGGKIVLTGNSFNRRGTITLFSDDDNDGIMVDAKGQDIRVETLSGVFYYNLVAGETTTGFNLLFDRAKADLQFAGASVPVKHDLIAYATFDKTWDLNDNSATYAPTTVHGGLAEGVKYDAASGNFTDAAGKTLDKNKYVAIDGVAYHAAYNEFLERVVTENGNGQDGETAARFGIYGGTAQAALAAATTTSDAIAARAGMGGKSASLSVAENSQGASLWLAPIYKASNSDGFAAQGVNYGVDIDMYGLALGGDYSLGNGMKFGAMFNLGSGDADGNGSASNVTNDFDYYGFGAYFGYSVDQFSILADVSYTIVDNDVSGTTTIDKLTASLDSKALSVGVTAQYEFDLGGVSFAPHAGARYTRLDLDSYDLKGNQIGDFAHSDSSDASIFSIPVGVTISKEIVSETWAVKPFVDLTLTANTGDDEIDSSMSWDNTNLVTGMKSEIFDSFTYGASAGVSAQSGNFSFGVSANYTGSSNMDEYGVSANARFVF